MKKKILSAVLALCLAFGSAAALPQSAVVESTNITASAETTATSGKCGDNLSWTLKNGVLTISGKGAMTDYYFNVTDPFRERTDIKSVIIKSGVTSIGAWTFTDCKNLTSVTIPSSVKSIGDSAFSFCTSLKSVTIPNSVTSIDYSAFSGCTSLTSVTIPNSVTSIGGEAFYGCTSLTSVTIPKSITSIGWQAFSETKWLENQQKKNPLVVVNGILIDGKKCKGKVTIPSSVTSINTGAFQECKSITSVTISGSVTSIGEVAFDRCTSLKSVTIQKGVGGVGEMAFNNCSSLTSITIANSVEHLGNSAFYGCNLKSVTIPKSVNNIGHFVFDDNTELKSITVEKGNEYYFSYDGVLYSNSILGPIRMLKCPQGKENIDIYDKVVSLGQSSLNYCTKLKTIVFPKSLKYLAGLKGCTGLKSIIIPSGVESIDPLTFSDCDNLTDVFIPDTVKSIDYDAFYNCKKLKSIIIPSSVTQIGDKAFGYYGDGFWEDKKLSGFIVYGAKGSAAEKYAKKNGFKFVARNTTEPKTVRYAGSDRAQTASLISSGMYKTADTVVLATGFDFHDALAAVPLASAYNAPLLLADRDNLSDSTIARIRLLKAKNVIVVASTNAKDQNGNDAAIRNKVYKQLKGYKVTKITGSSYYETAKNVAKNLKTKTGKNPTSVFITTDKNYADALSASPVAAILGAPILYVKSTGALNSNTTAYLKSIKSSVKNIYIVGGVNAVSKDVVAKIKTVLPNKKVTRFDGTDRYATCIKINDYFKSTLTGKSVCVAKGYNFPDALAGGVFAAKQKAPLFLADLSGNNAVLSSNQSSYLYEKNASKLYVFGGETAVPTALVKTIAKASV